MTRIASVALFMLAISGCASQSRNYFSGGQLFGVSFKSANVCGCERVDYSQFPRNRSSGESDGVDEQIVCHRSNYSINATVHTGATTQGLPKIYSASVTHEDSSFFFLDELAYDGIKQCVLSARQLGRREFFRVQKEFDRENK